MKILYSLAAITSLLVAAPASAHAVHTEHMTISSSFFSGLLHPILGIDHLLMLAAMGLLIARQLATTAKVTLSTIALANLTIGLGAGYLFGGFASMEIMIALSLVVSAVLLCSPENTFKPWSSSLTALCFGLLAMHGYAHGVEASGHIVGFGAGMFVSAAVLIVLSHRIGGVVSSRWASWSIAAGSLLFVALS
ncbi:HupE/UreJ family protein [Vibrio penaeicida]|uniref:HupE/UreJ family protein n=1 Tax=Vibrio penaeicida TaxID=104609 RepID=UPI00142E2D7E|nr:HupE/UreJ family protein [Vibrio penaeicida]